MRGFPPKTRHAGTALPQMPTYRKLWMPGAFNGKSCCFWALRGQCCCRCYRPLRLGTAPHHHVKAPPAQMIFYTHACSFARNGTGCCCCCTTPAPGKTHSRSACGLPVCGDLPEFRNESKLVQRAYCQQHRHDDERRTNWNTMYQEFDSKYMQEIETLLSLTRAVAVATL